jgi:ankyrin repeat protein
MAVLIKERLARMVSNIKESVEDRKVKKVERQRVKALTKELIEVVKNPDENAAQKIADLVAKGADINTFDMDKERSLLHFAAEQNRMDVVKALVENGCKKYINVNDIHGKDPAFYAIDNNNPEMLDYLLANGVSTNRPADFNLDSSFRYAVRSGHINLAEIELKYGADINDHVGEEFTLYGKYIKVYPGPTPLADVVHGQEINDGVAVRKKFDKAMVEFLLKNGARTDLNDPYGNDVKYIEALPEVRKILMDSQAQNNVTTTVALAKNKAKSND